MAARPHDLSSSDPQDQSLLSAALSGDDLAFTRALLAGADVNGVYEDGLNALIAVMTGQKCVRRIPPLFGSSFTYRPHLVGTP